ncbi:MAG: hypothetical protein HYZ58_19720 [Acidobacteria bacterium]|nr:hypothetical protein [Acidobacteriota bacterium]
MYCLVDPNGRVYLKDGAGSHEEIAAAFGLDESTCERYRFDLERRQFLRDHGGPVADRAAHVPLDRYVGTPERLMKFAEAGHLPKRVLASLLAPERRQAYLEACTAIEKAYTEACTAKNDPCLESGCASEGEICLQPLLREEVDYHRACAAEWIKLFANRGGRIDAWKN